MNKKNDNGQFCISLDFELMWGVKDTLGVEYSDNILSVHRSIPLMLKLFKQFNIRATWATVGFIALNKDNFSNYTSRIEHYPHYCSDKMNSLNDFSDVATMNEKLHFAKDLIGKIKADRNQDLGSHSASHLYYLDAKNKGESFYSDLLIGKSIFGEIGVKPTSFVFPRNQYDKNAVDMLSRFGFKCFRSTPCHWAYNSCSGGGNNLFKRIFRLLDSYINLSGYHVFDKNDIDISSTCKSIPASAFLRPVSNISILNHLRLRRIKNAMRYAAVNNQVFHLWWHPHNFGNDIDKNLKFLTSIFTYYDFLNKKYGFNSVNMNDFSQ